MSATLTHPVRTALLRARDLALTEETQDRAIRPGHLLLALLEDPDSSATRLLSEYCDVVKLRNYLVEHLTGPRESHWWEASEVPYSTASRMALALAEQEAESKAEPHLRPLHLLHGLFSLDLTQWETDLEMLNVHQAGIDLRDLRARVLAAGTA